MALFTKCILGEREVSDGVRISVMSKHTLNDGQTPDPRITSDKYDEHLPLLSPSPKLIGDYYRRGLPWVKFAERYLEQIRQPAVLSQVSGLALRALQTDITLLCIEESPTRCHRRLLAQECRDHYPSLIIEHH